MPGLAALTAVAGRLQAEGSSDLALRAAALSLALLGSFAQQEQIDAAEIEMAVRLHQRLLSVAQALGQPELAQAAQQSLGWVYNTLGNHFTDSDHVAAIAAYSQGIAADAANAMLYRNRAGVYLSMKAYDRAQADIETAARLEPEATRLAALRRDLAAGLAKETGGDDA